MDGILTSSGLAYIRGTGKNGLVKDFIVGLEDSNHPGIHRHEDLKYLQMPIANPAPPFRCSPFSDLSFPEIMYRLESFYDECHVLKILPHLLYDWGDYDDDTELKELKVTAAVELEEALTLYVPTYDGVFQALKDAYKKNNYKPILEDKYDSNFVFNKCNFKEAVKIAGDNNCPTLVRLLQECGANGILR